MSSLARHRTSVGQRRTPRLCLSCLPVVLAVPPLPVGFQNSAAGPDLGFLCSSLVLVDKAAEDRPALDPLLGEVRDRVVGPGRGGRSCRLR
jgi:hypothetical protein